MDNTKKKRLLLLLLFVLLVAYLWHRGREQTHYEWVEAPRSMERQALNDAHQASTNEILVDFVDDAAEARIAAIGRRFGLKLKLNSRFSSKRRLYRASVGSWGQKRVRQLLASLSKDPAVEIAERDLIYSIPPLEVGAIPRANAPEVSHKDFPNDPSFRFQWHLDQIGLKRAWKRSQGEDVIVAVIDTGVAFADRGSKFKQVPDLAGTQFVGGYDFVNDHEFALDDHGHGTHVAGTIAQSTHNAVGVAGVAFRAKIMPLKVLSARGFGNVADIAEAVRFAANHGAKVINMSLGGPRAAKVLKDAVDYAHKKGVLVVCAAGNDGRGRVGFPAAYPKAFAVAATQFDRTTTFYSNWGKEIDIAAPGGNTRVDQNNDGMPDGVLQNTIKIGQPAESDYLLFMGTSMAAPHVAGVAALVAAAGVSSPDAIAKILTSTAKHPQNVERDDHYGAGIVDAEAALAKVQQGWQGEALGGGAAMLLLFALAFPMARRRAVTRWIGRSALGVISGLVLGAGGLFFLPGLASSLGLSGECCALSRMLTSPFATWPNALMGGTQLNPLFVSALIPLIAAGLFMGMRRLRGLLFGFALGVAVQLFFYVFRAGALDIAWIPGALETSFLVLNGTLALGLAALIAQSASVSASERS